uniref:RNA-directed DNA polymerase n=1 Tax=Panagrellus redivivus TaxID=6233 RepID=A0A7E4ZU05_PANRE
MRPQKSKQDIKRFLGLAGFFRRFVENFAEIATPLSNLLKDGAEFKWSNLEEDAFKQLIQRLTSAPILVQPDYSKEFVVHTDASLSAIGGAIMQEDKEGQLKAIGYASRTLTDAEKNYPAVEAELLAIVFVLKQFKHILYGSNILLKTDHKPLVYLFRKLSTSPKLNRWLMEIQDFHLTVQHLAGTSNVIADALSRPATETLAIGTMEKPLIQKLKEETAKDATLTCFIKGLEGKWKEAEGLAGKCKELWAVRDDLSLEDGILRKKGLAVIPESMRKEVLKRLHLAHFGAERMKRQARQWLWWPGMATQIDKWVEGCDPCQTHGNAKRMDAPESWPQEDGAWRRIHLDFAGPKWNAMWLICIDAFARYPLVIRMTKTTAEALIKALDPIFALFGFPRTVVTDNGPQFASQAFRAYLEKNGVRLIHTPPYNPRSNGLAERFVQTFKASVTKQLAAEPALAPSEAVKRLLQAYRTTPMEGQASPAEIMFGRKPVTSWTTLGATPSEREEPPPDSGFQNGDLLRRYNTETKQWQCCRFTTMEGRKIAVVIDEEDGHQHRVPLDRLKRRSSPVFIVSRTVGIKTDCFRFGMCTIVVRPSFDVTLLYPAETMAALVKRWNAELIFLWSDGSPVWFALERPGREAGDYTLLWKADAATTIPQPGATQSTIGCDVMASSGSRPERRRLVSAIVGNLTEAYYSNGSVADRRRLIPEAFTMEDRFWGLDTLYETAHLQAVKYVQPRTAAPLRTPSPSITPEP